MNFLTTKDSFFEINDQKVVPVFVEPWNASVYIRRVPSIEWDAWEITMTADSKESKLDMQNFRARLAAMCLCDENGKPIFTDKDALELGKKSKLAMDIIMEHAKELNGMSKDDEKKLTKDLGTTPDAEDDSK
jgi:hypothetical protein